MSVLHPHPSRWKGIRPHERHSLVLQVAGVIYVARGIAYTLADPTDDQVQALHYALQWCSLQTWGIIWILVGLLAMLSSRWPPVHETWGYMVLTGQSAGWGAFYLVGVVWGHSPPINLTGALTMGLLGFMWWGISGLVNPKHQDKDVLLIDMLKRQNESLRRQTDSLLRMVQDL